MSMILASLMGATPSPVFPSTLPPAATEEDIVVIGRRLREVRFRFQANGGKLRFCKITKSTGDKILDRLTCDAAKRCAADRPKNVAEMTTCMTGQREQVLAALRAAQSHKGRN